MDTLETTLFMLGTVSLIFGLTLLIVKRKAKSSLMYIVVGLLSLAATAIFCDENIYTAILAYKKADFNPYLCAFTFFILFGSMICLDVYKIDKKSQVYRK